MSQPVYEGVVVAQQLRRELNLADTSHVDCILELAEERLGLEVVLAPLASAVSGFYLPAAPTPLVIVQSTHPVQRQRFTIAHEVGHHALGHAAAPRIQETTPAPEPSDGTVAVAVVAAAPATADHYRPQRRQSPDEQSANAFAGELLVPAAGAREVAARSAGQSPLDQAVRLSSHFGISAFAAVVRLEMLGTFDRATAKATRTQLAAGEHLPRYEELGLAALDDQLQRHADAGGGHRCSATARGTLARLRAEFDGLQR